MWLLVFIVAMAGVAFVAARLIARRTRARALAAPLPEEALALLERCVPLYRALPAALKPALQRALREFLHDKHFVGCDGLAITEEMRLVIAAQACLLVCVRQDARYTGFTSVLVYPDAFVVDLVEHDGEVEIRSAET
ncbi:MAG: zinc-dependent peptidase, partial [Gammaproteobacteria bacterium]